MNTDFNGSGRSREWTDSNPFLALIHHIFGSSVDPGCFIYSKNYECRRGLTVKACIALGQGVKVILERRNNVKRTVLGITAVLMTMLLLFSTGTITEAGQAGKVSFTVLNPQGPVKIEKELAPRLETLEGKKVALWLSATRGQLYAGKGAELYDILEKMLKEKFADIHIVPYMALPMKWMPENDVIAAIEKVKPDAVVAGFGG